MATPAQPQAQPPPRALLLHRLPTLPRQSHPMEHTILTQRCRSIKREMIRPKARSIPPTTTAAATLSIPVPWLRRAPLPLHSPRCSSSWRETNLDRCTTSSRPPSRRQPSRKTLGGRTKVAIYMTAFARAGVQTGLVPRLTTLPAPRAPISYFDALSSTADAATSSTGRDTRIDGSSTPPNKGPEAGGT